MTPPEVMYALLEGRKIRNTNWKQRSCLNWEVKYLHLVKGRLCDDTGRYVCGLAINRLGWEIAE